MIPSTRPALEKFLQLLFPWGNEHANLYKSCSWTFRPASEPNEVKLANYATQGYSDFIRLIESRSRLPGANTYVALGTQRLASVEKYSRDGFPKAIRQINNIVSHNSIWLDMDVKPNGKGYATTDDAFAALDDFIAVTGLPPATMEVLSGTGGFHAYWCTPEPMPVEAWIPLSRALRDAALAYGLKFDPQVTVNPAGVLRVPGTFNFKTQPPGVVQLMEDSSFAVYPFQQLVGALGAYAGHLPGVRVNPPPGVHAGSGGAYTANFTENVPSAPPVPIDAVGAVCGVVNDILDREGDGDAEPLWNLAMLLASFTEDPVDAAHKMSRGDRRYTQAETDKKLAEKVMARGANPNLGWPQCASFSPLHPACATCPLFAQGKSPLSFARRPAPQPAIGFVQPASTGSSQITPSNDPLMPAGYWRDINKHVHTTMQNDKGDSYVVDVLSYPVLDAGIDPNTGQLIMKTVISGREKWGGLNANKGLLPATAGSEFASIGIYVPPFNHKPARDYLVAWMTRLQEMKRVAAPATLGWTDDGGFTFADKTYRATGMELVYRGNKLDDRFVVKGELAPWQKAMSLVYGNPPLETAVATAFAAPLVELAGPVSLVVSIYSHLSGVGKSTALQLAQAVWGNPRTGMSSLDDTQNSVMKKIADLKSLPVYWDELRTTDQLEKVVGLIFSVTQGKAKSRLNRDATQQEAGSFTTMFCIASNHGVSDSVYAGTEATEAGGLRVFEIEADPLPTSSGILDWQARQMILQLSQNYGAAGATYGEFLARNKKAIVQLLTAINQRLDQRYNFGSKERFWSMTMVTIIAGAMLANKCGLTTFDIAKLERYLDECMLRQRDTLKTQEYTTLSAPDAVEGLLQEYYSEIRAQHLIITSRIHSATPIGGRPVPVQLLDTDPQRITDVWVQLCPTNQTALLRVRPWLKWLRERRQNPVDIMHKLEKIYTVVKTRQKMAAGVQFLGGIADFGKHECYFLVPKTINPAPSPSPGSSSPLLL